jgi:hypothetical protein
VVPVEDAPPVELPVPVEVAPVELAAPVELPVELAPVPVVTEPLVPVEDALAAVLEPFAPIEPEIAPRRQAAFTPTSNRQAMIRHFTLEDCAEQPNPSRTRESYHFRAGTEAGATRFSHSPPVRRPPRRWYAAAHGRPRNEDSRPSERGPRSASPDHARALRSRLRWPSELHRLLHEHHRLRGFGRTRSCAHGRLRRGPERSVWLV